MSMESEDGMNTPLTKAQALDLGAKYMTERVVLTNGDVVMLRHAFTVHRITPRMLKMAINRLT